MAAHAHDLEHMEEQLDSQMQRQQMVLKDRLDERRQRKLKHLRRKQELELTKEMLTQKKECDEIRTTKVCLYFLSECLKFLDRVLFSVPIFAMSSRKQKKNWSP